MTPTYSVIIPAFGYQELLNQTLDTFFKQTLKPYEIIVVDDGSSPALTVPDGVKLIRIDRERKHRGSSAAKNLGASAAKGDYVIFADASVLVMPETLDSMNEEFKRLTSRGRDALLNVWRIGLTDTYGPDETSDMRKFLRKIREKGTYELHEEFHEDPLQEEMELCTEQNCGGMLRGLFWAVGGYNDSALPSWGYNNHDLDLRCLERGITVNSRIPRIGSGRRLLCFHNWHPAPIDKAAKQQAKDEFVAVWGVPYSPSLWHLKLEEGKALLGIK